MKKRSLQMTSCLDLIGQDGNEHNRRMQTLGLLSGGAAHDFNNVLTVLIGASESALARPRLNRQVAADLRLIRAEAERGSAMIRHMLQRESMPEQARTISINVALQGALGLLRRLCPDRVAMSLDLQDAPLRVRIDPVQFDRILINLVVNARTAMPDGGTLLLRSYGVVLNDYQARQTGLVPGRHVVLEVEDTGCGIRPDLLPTIFEPFVTTHGDVGGTGMGLTTVRAIAQQAGGRVNVSSVPGRGSCFQLCLPGLDPVRRMRDGATVLLVEDDDSVLHLTERMFTLRGWRVLTAATVDAALVQACAITPTLVISDIGLPGRDGVELVRELRRGCPDLPAILVSGAWNDTLRADLAKAAITFVPKPYSLADLVRVAADLLECS